MCRKASGSMRRMFSMLSDSTGCAVLLLLLGLFHHPAGARVSSTAFLLHIAAADEAVPHRLSAQHDTKVRQLSSARHDTRTCAPLGSRKTGRWHAGSLGTCTGPAGPPEQPPAAQGWQHPCLDMRRQQQQRQQRRQQQQLCPCQTTAQHSGPDILCGQCPTQHSAHRHIQLLGPQALCEQVPRPGWQGCLPSASLSSTFCSTASTCSTLQLPSTFHSASSTWQMAAITPSDALWDCRAKAAQAQVRRTAAAVAGEQGKAEVVVKSAQRHGRCWFAETDCHSHPSY